VDSLIELRGFELTLASLQQFTALSTYRIRATLKKRWALLPGAAFKEFTYLGNLLGCREGAPPQQPSPLADEAFNFSSYDQPPTPK
jgi:hypothetical protein